MIQIYTGDGKGKTQSAIGATIRGAGHGLPVLFCQFLKDDSSGEISILKELKEVEVFHAPKDYGFYFQMSEEEKAFTKKEAKLLFNQVIEKAKVKFDGDFLKRNEEFDSAIAKSSVTTLGDREEMAVKGIIVFDELLVALDLGILEEDDVRNTLSSLPKNWEVILTGQNKKCQLFDLADYVSVIEKRKHPFDSGQEARCGVEY